MRLLFILLLLGTGWSCRGQWIATHAYESYRETRQIGCYALGYCRSCHWSFDYHLCSWGPYNRCPGTRDILVEVTPEDGYYINYPTKVVKVRR